MIHLNGIPQIMVANQQVAPMGLGAVTKRVAINGPLLTELENTNDSKGSEA